MPLPKDTRHFEAALTPKEHHDRLCVGVYKPVLLHTVLGVLVKFGRPIALGRGPGENFDHQVGSALDVLTREDVAFLVWNEQDIRLYNVRIRKHNVSGGGNYRSQLSLTYKPMK